MKLEWDSAKDAANRAKHGLSFAEAARLLTSGVDFLEIYDERHSLEEDRFIAIGGIQRGLIVVVYTERLDDAIRILSARFATSNERRLYRKYWSDHER